MSYRGLKAFLIACSGLAALVVATADANAGGLAVREQSAYGQGTSFAGVAAGGSLSSMFWNPATMTQQAGLQIESAVSGLIPYSANRRLAVTSAGTSLAFGGTDNVGNAALGPRPAITPTNSIRSYGSACRSMRRSVLPKHFPMDGAGRTYAAGGENLTTYNFAPIIAYKSTIGSVSVWVRKSNMPVALHARHPWLRPTIRPPPTAPVRATASPPASP